VSSKYLGLPLLFGKKKTTAFKDLLSKVSGKIDGWRAKTLSQAGRSVLIKYVAATIPSYAMSSFLLPTSISSSLDRAFKNFWWGFRRIKLEISPLNLGIPFAYQRKKEVWDFAVCTTLI
jgi:hypothetical protein